MIKRRILRWEVIPDYPSRLDVIPVLREREVGKPESEMKVIAEAEDVVTQSQ